MSNEVFNRLASDSTDLYGTPSYATQMVVPFLSKQHVIWEPCAGFGAIADHLTSCGFNVMSTDISSGLDALLKTPVEHFDCIVTNPPYSLKTEFLQRCYELGKPFALLLPCDLVNKKRTALMQKYGVQLIVPHKRIKFLRFDGKQIREAASPNMGSCWFTWKLSLSSDIVFVS